MAAASKHLVLDDDVHEILRNTKQLTGHSIRETGNRFLRSSLEPVFLCNVVGRVLVDAGKVSDAEYRQMLEQAALETRRAHAVNAAPVTRTRKGTLVSGSWEIKEIFSAPGDAFQILECWARDSNQLAMEAHCHDADEFVIALSGRTLIAMNEVPFTLGARAMLQIPAGYVHSGTPLDSTVHIVAVLMPAVPGYCS